MPAAIDRSESLPLGAPCFVFTHHGFIFGDGVGGAVGDVFPRGRESTAEEFEEAVRSKQSAYLKEVRAKSPEQQEAVCGIHARQKHVGRRELRESSSIGEIPAVGGGGWENGALDHEGGHRIVGKQCEAIPLYL